MKEKICPVCNTLHKNPASDMCYKHYQQVRKYGKIMCPNSRTVFNMNEVRVLTEWCEIDTYDKFGNTIATFKFDKEFLPLIYKYKWQCVEKGTKIKSKYLITTIDKKRFYFHRLIMGEPINEIDHINRDSTDNRLCNLRESYRSEQLHNTRKRGGMSKYKGIYYSSTRNKNKNWHAELQINGKRYYSPWYETEEETIYARYIMEKRFKVEIFQNQEVLEEAINKLSKIQKLSIEKCLLNKWKH